MTRPWTQLSDKDALEFLNAVREEDFRVFFEPSICEVFKHPLPFFHGYDLIRISNKYSPPFVLLDYISNGENHYYLDGSDAALQTICAQGSLSLDEENVLLYIDLYLSYVYERGNSLVYIDDPQRTGIRGSDAFAVHFQAIQQHQDAQVKWDAKTKNFEIQTPLLYQEKSTQSLVLVNKKGKIAIKEPIAVSFLEKPKSFDSISYIHPKEAGILEQCRTILAKTAAGKRLLDVAETCKIEIRVISSPNIQAVAYNKPYVHVFMPADQYTADYPVALALAGALNDVEQILRGYKRPSIDEDDEIYLAINYDKNLKLLVEICKIAEEFEQSNDLDAVIGLRRLGQQDLYAAYKQRASATALMRVYLATLVEQGFIREEH